MTDTEFQIRMRLSMYLAGESTLAEFKSWFLPSTWNLEGRDAKLATTIRSCLAEGLTEELKLLVTDYATTASS